MGVADSASSSEVTDSTTTGCGLGSLLDARDAKLVTLVAEETELAVHRAVLVAKSPVFAAMLADDDAGAAGGRIVVADVKPKVLEQLVTFLYRDGTPELCGMAPQLLSAADKYGVLDLKAKCELQLALNLSVENLVTSAFLAMRHSCPRLEQTARCLFQANPTAVMGTEGWAEAVRNTPEEFLKLCRLLAWNAEKSRHDCEEDMDKKLLEAVENYRLEPVRKMLATGWTVGARDACGRTVLHYATNSTISNCLLGAGALVNARDNCHRTPLHAAVMIRSVSMASVLIKASGDVNAADVFGNTPLHLAAELDSEEMVKTLLEEGAEKGAKNCFLETPLDIANRCNQKRLLPHLSVSGSASTAANPETPEETSSCSLGPLLEARDASLITLVAGETELAVHRSVLVARSPVFAAMLAHDTVEASSGRIVIPDIEPHVLQQLVLFMYRERAPEFYTVGKQLLVAADKYCMPDLKEQCEQQLVRDLSLKNVVANSLLAVRHSCPNLKKTVGQFLRANITRVMETAGWEKAVTDNPEEFLEVCRLVATEPALTRTAAEEVLDKKLLKEVEAFSDCVKKLLTSGASVGARDASGRTALHKSAGCPRNGSIKLKLLLAFGADLGARDTDGRTPLHYAAASGREEETKCLLQAGACVDATDRWLQTPLHTAVQKGNLGAVLQLLAVPTDVNARDVYGHTPLHLAAQLGNENVCLALLNVVTDEHIKKDIHESLLDLVKRSNMHRLLDMISSLVPPTDEGNSQALPASITFQDEGLSMMDISTDSQP